MKIIIKKHFLLLQSLHQYKQNLSNDFLCIPWDMSYKSYQLEVFVQLMWILLTNHLQKHQNLPECNICLGLEDIRLIQNQYFQTLIWLSVNLVRTRPGWHKISESWIDKRLNLSFEQLRSFFLNLNNILRNFTVKQGSWFPFYVTL